MRPTDSARLILFALATLSIATPAHAERAVRLRLRGVASAICTRRTPAMFEVTFCTSLDDELRAYRLGKVAANRTLRKTSVEFTIWSQDIGAVVIVVVRDPIGKNSVKLVFAAGTTAEAAANRAVEAFRQVLQLRPTKAGAEAVVVFPNPLVLR